MAEPLARVEFSDGAGSTPTSPRPAVAFARCSRTIVAPNDLARAT